MDLDTLGVHRVAVHSDRVSRCCFVFHAATGNEMCAMRKELGDLASEIRNVHKWRTDVRVLHGTLLDVAEYAIGG